MNLCIASDVRRAHLQSMELNHASQRLIPTGEISSINVYLAPGDDRTIDILSFEAGSVRDCVNMPYCKRCFTELFA